MLAVQGVHGSEMLLVLKEPQTLTSTVACKLSDYGLQEMETQV